jgi:large subunit ribosomal protein L18
MLSISEKQQTGLNGTRIERAKQIGIKISELAKKKKITKVVFDKGKYAYHGRVKALADGAREGGLVF